MKVYRIDQFKCHFCSEWFNASTRLPLHLRCSHNVCRVCIDSSRRPGQPLKIVCPQDLEVSVYRSVEDIDVDVVTKHVLERLLSQNDMRKCNNQLDMIKEYSKTFDELSCQASTQVQKLNELLDQIYRDQINRIECIWTRVKLEVNRPVKIIEDWKSIVKGYLKTLKKNTTENGVCDLTQFEHYLEEAKKVHLQVVNFLNTNRDKAVESIISNRTMCFVNDFSLVHINKPNINGKENQSKVQTQVHVNGYKPLRNQNLQQIRKRTSQNFDSSTSRRILNQIANNINLPNNYQKDKDENSKSCSVFDLSKSVSIAGDCTNIRDLPEKMSQMKRLADRGRPDRYEIDSSPVLKGNQPASGATTKTVVKGAGGRSSRGQSSHEEVLKEIEQLNEEMLISTYDENLHMNAEISLDETNQKCSTEGSAAHHRFEYHEPTAQLRDKITRALKRPNSLVNYLRAESKKESVESPTHQTRRGYIYDCEAQKQSYALKMRIMKVQEALLNTTVGSNFIQLMNHPLESVDFRCYLQVLPWDPRIEILKFVKTNLRDEQFNTLLNFVARYSNIHTLVVSSNQLTEDSLDMLLMFLETNNLRSVYLSKNYVNLLRAKPKIAQLKAQNINIYV